MSRLSGEYLLGCFRSVAEVNRWDIKRHVIAKGLSDYYVEFQKSKLNLLVGAEYEGDGSTSLWLKGVELDYESINMGYDSCCWPDEHFKNPFESTRSELVAFEEQYGVPWVLTFDRELNKYYE